MTTGFHCPGCDAWHDELPLNFSVAEPGAVPSDPSERARTVTGTGDFREVVQQGATHYFIRGLIELPILESDQTFSFGVWTSLSERSYAAAREAYRKQTGAGPFFGWLNNHIPIYPETVNLKTHVHVRVDLVAAIELEPTDHPLAVEQRDGISMARVHEIVSALMHPAG